MSDRLVVDARGLSCPQPVILARTAIQTAKFPIEVLVDTVTSRENVRRAAEKLVLVAVAMAGRVDVANGYHLHVGQGEECRHIDCALVAATDDPDMDPVAGRGRPEHRSRQHGRQATGRHRQFQQFSAFHGSRSLGIGGFSCGRPISFCRLSFDTFAIPIQPNRHAICRNPQLRHFVLTLRTRPLPLRCPPR